MPSQPFTYRCQRQLRHMRLLFSILNPSEALGRSAPDLEQLAIGSPA